jgi:hypothetical protein
LGLMIAAPNPNTTNKPPQNRKSWRTSCSGSRLLLRLARVPQLQAST